MRFFKEGRGKKKKTKKTWRLDSKVKTRTFLHLRLVQSDRFTSERTDLCCVMSLRQQAKGLHQLSRQKCADVLHGVLLHCGSLEVLWKVTASIRMLGNTGGSLRLHGKTSLCSCVCDRTKFFSADVTECTQTEWTSYFTLRFFKNMSWFAYRNMA